MEIYNTLSGCGETIGYFTNTGIVVYIATWLVFGFLSMIALILAADRVFGEENWFSKNIDSATENMLAFLLVWFFAMVFVVRLFFPTAEAFDKDGAKEILADRLKEKSECLDAAVHYGADIKQLSPTVLENYHGADSKIYDEIIKRYSIGVGGFSQDTTKAAIMKIEKEVAVDRLEPQIPPPPPMGPLDMKAPKLPCNEGETKK